jgi:hypothetical protein
MEHWWKRAVVSGPHNGTLLFTARLDRHGFMSARKVTGIFRQETGGDHSWSPGFPVRFPCPFPTLRISRAAPCFTVILGIQFWGCLLYLYLHLINVYSGASGNEGKCGKYGIHGFFRRRMQDMDHRRLPSAQEDAKDPGHGLERLPALPLPHQGDAL